MCTLYDWFSCHKNAFLGERRKLAVGTFAHAQVAFAEIEGRLVPVLYPEKKKKTKPKHGKPLKNCLCLGTPSIRTTFSILLEAADSVS